MPSRPGQKLPEAEEAKAVTELDTARDAALWLRYAEDPEKYEAALEKLKELLPEGSPTRDAVVAWVRGRLTAKGVKEGEALGQRATLVRQARRKFGAETADELAGLLERVTDRERTAQVADLIIDCASGRDLLEQADRLGLASPVETSSRATCSGR